MSAALKPFMKIGALHNKGLEAFVRNAPASCRASAQDVYQRWGRRSLTQRMFLSLPRPRTSPLSFALEEHTYLLVCEVSLQLINASRGPVVYNQ
jgi:hypothetical protein